MTILMHGHHAETLFTFGRELDERVAQIEAEKPAEEQALRLALIQDVTNLLPRNKALAASETAWAASEKARAASEKALGASETARAASEKARAASEKAMAASEKALAASEKAWAASEKALGSLRTALAAYVASFDGEAFHREHCHPNCPWDGQTIFAKGTGIEGLA